MKLLLLTGLLLAVTARGGIPYPAALDAAAVSEARIADLNREALVLGNGDLIGLLWERNRTLCLRVAKNDIWDARVDTSEDLPLMKVIWMTADGGTKSYGLIDPARTMRQQTRPGAVWEIRSEKGARLGHFTIGDRTAKAAIPDGEATQTKSNSGKP